MSNQAVGGLYQTIIEEVINSSRVDFEESGVEESVLEELRLGWQQKLSQLDVARFPWDPKPEPSPNPVSAPPPQPATPTHTQAQFTSQLPLPMGAPLNGLPSSVSIPQDAVHVKQEPGLPPNQEPVSQQLPGAAYPNYSSMEKTSVAANRAAQQLQAQYGLRAAGSINAIQDRIGQQPGVKQSHSPQPPNQQLQHPQQHPQQHQQQQQQQQLQQQHLQLQQPPHQQQQLPPQGQPPLGQAQTDGAGDAAKDSSDDDNDLEAVLLRQGITGKLEELGRVEVDRILHDQLAAKARSMEGGGLMLPLREATKKQRTRSQKMRASSKSCEDKGKGVALYDGGDDDDDIDEDAINSDLDDSDEGGEDDEVDDEGLGHIMLCMYDKVQRVKNKWKCTLKDGVLTVNGKEYVFNKATGEYEW